MTVKELIEILKGFNGDDEVGMYGSCDGGCGYHTAELVVCHNGWNESIIESDYEGEVSKC